jgi:hypothetical protein
MSTLGTLKKLLLGETWFLPVGLVAILAAAELIVRPLLHGTWKDLGGFVLLAAVTALLLASGARTARRR